MSAFKNNWLRSTLFSAVLIASGGLCEGQDNPATETRQVPQLTAFTPFKVRIRQKSGITASGTLISLTEESVHFRAPRGKEVEVELDKISNIRTVDGKLDYSPGRETFQSLVDRANQIPGLGVGTTTIEVPIERTPPIRNEVPDSPEPPPAINPLEPVPGSPPTEGPDSASGETASVVREPGSTIYTCSSCGKEVPGTLKNGDRCPHCRVLIWERVQQASLPPNPGPAPPRTVGGTTPTAPVDPLNQPAVSSPTAGATQTPGSDLSDMPLWMKVGVFVGMLAVAWIVFQRR